MCTNSVFEEAWWLDAVAPGQWKELIIKHNNDIVARWPVVWVKNHIYTPKYTQTLGIYLNPQYVTTIEDEEKIYLQLLNQIPTDVNISVSLAPQNRFFLPFVWNNCTIGSHASFCIDKLDDLDAIFRHFSHHIQRDITGAQKKVSIMESQDIEMLISMSIDTYAKQKRAYVVQPEIIRRIFIAATEHNACKLYMAKDMLGQIHSMAFFVYDENRCYYLIGANNAVLNAKSCANTLLLWQGIQLAASVSKIFDFEGSQIKGIATFFRRFGADFVPHYTISRQSLLGELKNMIKPRIKSILGHKK